MRDQLPTQPNSAETSIINIDINRGPGTHFVAYAIDPRAIVYFDSYGFSPAGRMHALYTIKIYDLVFHATKTTIK